MPRVAFMFPGQGAQTVGMAQALCETVPAARALFDQAAAALGMSRSTLYRRLRMYGLAPGRTVL